MSIRISQNSFSKGIISPSLHGRVDLEQYNLGVKTLENGIVMQEGCVINRSGLEFLQNAKYDNKTTRLIPFVFNINQNYILEFGDKYIRFLKDGGYILNNNNEIYELATEYEEEDLFEIDYTQQADVMTFVHKNYKPITLSRIEHNQWQIKTIDFTSKINPPSNVTAEYTGSLQENTKEYEYVICAVDKATNEESNRSAISKVTGHLEAYWTTSEYITLSWEKVENALEYNIYRSVNGIFGYIGTSTTTSFKDDNIEPDLTSCAPIFNNPFIENNPSSVCYFQQRKIYASSNKNPQTIWASQSGNEENFNISRPLNATDAITLTIYDNVANNIQHLIPFDDLLVITNNSEWCVNGKDKIFSATPTPFANMQSYYGASKVKPVISGSMVLFVQSGGNIVRDLGYNYLANSYDGEELTLFANHLFEGKKIVDMAYCKEPYRILWCIMDDGTLNGLTYNPKQKICAWHTHKTDGKFKSIATVREENEDIAYFVIERNINNNQKNFIERFKTRNIKSLNDGFFLDCALKKSFNTKVSKITGLNHLINKEVTALLDCGVVENLKINENGEVILPYEAKDVLIGIPFDFKLETLNLENENSLGIKKVLNKIEVKIIDSREDFFIENENGTLVQNSRSRESINNPEQLFTKNVEFSPLNNARIEASAKIIQKYPLPLKIVSISSTISLEEVEML